MRTRREFQRLSTMRSPPPWPTIAEPDGAGSPSRVLRYPAGDRQSGSYEPNPPEQKRNIGVAFKNSPWYYTQHNSCISTNGFLTLAEESTHGNQHRSAQRNEEHRSDRTTRGPPCATYARVARHRQRGRVWNLVPDEARGRVYRGQTDQGHDHGAGLRAFDRNARR